MESKLILDLESSNTKKDLQRSSCFTKPKLIAAVALVLGLAAIAGACAVVAVALLPAKSGKREEHMEQVEADDQVASIARRQGPVTNNLYESCPSNKTNDSIPAAYISGRRVKWSEETLFRSRGVRPYMGYQTYWNCNTGSSFVKGGMRFDQDDRSLYFPTCGHYYISSQILFQYSLNNNQPNQNYSAQHGIEIKPNCGRYDYPRYLYSYSSLEQKEHVRTSTYIGDIAKICEGGSIKIVIPTQDNVCCAQGESMMTHFSTFLIEETDCS